MRLNHAPHCHAVIRGLGKTTARAKVVNTFLMQNARITFLMQIARILPVTCSFLNWGGKGLTPRCPLLANSTVLLFQSYDFSSKCFLRVDVTSLLCLYN